MRRPTASSCGPRAMWPMPRVSWIHFDDVPGEPDIRDGGAMVTGRICVIGSHLDEEAVAKLFGVEAEQIRHGYADIRLHGLSGESGKTKFIQETLEDERFNTGERTLLLVFEEGEEEYDAVPLPRQGRLSEQVLDYDELSPEMLTGLQDEIQRRARGCGAQRHALDPRIRSRRLPDHWKIAQEFMFADATTFLSYNATCASSSWTSSRVRRCWCSTANARRGRHALPQDRPGRQPPDRDLVRVHRRLDHYDDIEDPLPFDLNAPVVEVKDGDYALFYRDITEEPKKYAGKTVKFKGQVARLRREKDGMFAPGRFVMTCCEADITFMGLPCRFAGVFRAGGAQPGLGHGDRRGQVPLALQGRGSHPHRRQRSARRTRRAERRDLLSFPECKTADGSSQLPWRFWRACCA